MSAASIAPESARRPLVSQNPLALDIQELADGNLPPWLEDIDSLYTEIGAASCTLAGISMEKSPDETQIPELFRTMRRFQGRDFVFHGLSAAVAAAEVAEQAVSSGSWQEAAAVDGWQYSETSIIEEKHASYYPPAWYGVLAVTGAGVHTGQVQAADHLDTRVPRWRGVAMGARNVSGDAQVQARRAVWQMIDDSPDLRAVHESLAGQPLDSVEESAELARAIKEHNGIEISPRLLQLNPAKYDLYYRFRQHALFNAETATIQAKQIYDDALSRVALLGFQNRSPEKIVDIMLHPGTIADIARVTQTTAVRVPFREGEDPRSKDFGAQRHEHEEDKYTALLMSARQLAAGIEPGGHGFVIPRREAPGPQRGGCAAQYPLIVGREASGQDTVSARLARAATALSEHFYQAHGIETSLIREGRDRRTGHVVNYMNPVEVLIAGSIALSATPGGPLTESSVAKVLAYNKRLE